MTEETKKGGGIKKVGIELEGLVIQRIRKDLERLPTAEARSRVLKFIISTIVDDRAAEANGQHAPGQPGQVVLPGVPAPEKQDW